MKKQELMDALNETAKDIGIYHWIPVEDITFIPMAMNQLSSTLWIQEFPENENTKLIREQQKNLFFHGGMKFED